MPVWGRDFQFRFIISFRFISFLRFYSASIGCQVWELFDHQQLNNARDHLLAYACSYFVYEKEHKPIRLKLASKQTDCVGYGPLAKQLVFPASSYKYHNNKSTGTAIVPD